MDGIMKQEFDDYKLLPSNSVEPIEHSYISIKQELEDYTLFSPNDVYMLEGKIKTEDHKPMNQFSHKNGVIEDNILEASQSTYCVKSERQKIEEVELGKFECIDIKTEKTSEKTETFNQYLSESTYNVHLKTEDYHCKFCNARFKSKRSVSIHITAVHFRKRTEHICKICNASFTASIYVNKHINDFHINKKVFKEHICATSENLNKQFNSKHNDYSKTKKFNFNFCSVTSELQQSVNRHTTAVNLKKRKNICNFCETSFMSNQSLKKHIDNVHSETKVSISDTECFNHNLEEDVVAVISIDELKKSPQLLRHKLDKNMFARIKFSQLKKLQKPFKLKESVIATASLKQSKESKEHFNQNLKPKKPLKHNLKNSVVKRISVDHSITYQPFNHNFRESVDPSDKSPWRYSL